jgi:hypothetical protein
MTRSSDSLVWIRRAAIGTYVARSLSTKLARRSFARITSFVVLLDFPVK